MDQSLITRFSRRLIAWVTLGSFLIAGPAPVMAAGPLDLEPVELAHHGGEGGGAALPAATAGSAAAVTTVQGKISKTLVAESLWGNMLLNMAYQRDPEIQRIAKRMGQVNAGTMLGVAGVSGLSLASGIVSFNSIQEEVVDVTPAHGPGGSDHVHLHMEDRTPAAMSIVSSGLTLLTIGTSAALNKYYSRQLSKRQEKIIEQIDAILAQLEAGAPSAEVAPLLSVLVGERASREFLHLWQVTHPPGLHDTRD